MTGITIETGPSDKSLPTTKAEIAEVKTDYCQAGFSAADAIKCEETDGWSLDQIGVPHAAMFVLRHPVEIPATVESSSDSNSTPAADTT